MSHCNYIIKAHKKEQGYPYCEQCLASLTQVDRIRFVGRGGKVLLHCFKTYVQPGPKAHRTLVITNKQFHKFYLGVNEALCTVACLFFGARVAILMQCRQCLRNQVGSMFTKRDIQLCLMALQPESFHFLLQERHRCDETEITNLQSPAGENHCVNNNRHFKQHFICSVCCTSIN